VCAFVASALAGTAEVVAAPDAEHGLALAGGQDFDGALLDDGLPDLAGVELLRLIRADPRTLSLPVVLFTGRDEPDLEERARRAGADDFLCKPVAPQLLEQRVKALLQREARSLPLPAGR
jgi:DNA-binding response OmpR family regulator